MKQGIGYRVSAIVGIAFLLFTIHDPRSTAFADVVYFSSGETLKGLVVEEHHDRVIVSTEEGEKAVFRSEVDEIFYSDQDRNYLYLGNEALEEGEIALAQGLFRKALQINPRLSEAEDALHRLEDLRQKQAQGAGARRGGDPARDLEKSLGLILKPSERYAAVVAVREGSAAGLAGISSEDKLVAHWSYSLAFLPAEQVAAHLAGPAGTPLKVTIERQVWLAGEAASPGGEPKMELEMDRLGLAVRRAAPSGDPLQETLRPGDRIVEIAGESTRYMPLREAERRIAEAGQQGIQVVIHRDVMIQRE